MVARNLKQALFPASPRGGESSGRNGARVVYLMTTFMPEVGGTVTQIANQAKGLTEFGYDATVLTALSRPELARRERLDGIDVRRFRGIPGLPMRAVLICQWAFWLARHRRDIAVIHAVMHPDLLCAVAAPELRDRKVMLWVTDGDVQRTLGEPRGWSSARVGGRIIRSARRRAVRNATNIALTTTMAREAEPYCETPPIVIPVPVDSAHFRSPTESERVDARRRLDLRHDEVGIVCVGHIERRKGLRNLLEALDSTESERLHLIVVGAERETDGYSLEVRALASKLGSRRRVTFAGRQRDVRDPFLWAADVFVLPSEREGLPNAALEAMACGLPCILPRNAGGASLINDAFGVAPVDNSAPALAAALSTVLRRRGEWGAMGARARAAAEGYSVSAVCRQYSELYRRVIDVAGGDDGAAI